MTGAAFFVRFAENNLIYITEYEEFKVYAIRCEPVVMFRM